MKSSGLLETDGCDDGIEVSAPVAFSFGKEVMFTTLFGAFLFLWLLLETK
jgi:predicted secreted protein